MDTANTLDDSLKQLRDQVLNLVDLAGMESSKKSYAVEGASNNPARREEMLLTRKYKVES